MDDKNVNCNEMYQIPKMESPIARIKRVAWKHMNDYCLGHVSEDPSEWMTKHKTGQTDVKLPIRGRKGNSWKKNYEKY